MQTDEAALAKRMENEELVRCVHLLVAKFVSPQNRAQYEKYFGLLMHLISTNAKQSLDRDESQVIARIRKTVSREKGFGEAALLDQYLNKLGTSSSLSSNWAILYLLDQLKGGINKDAPTSTMPKTLFSAQALPDKTPVAVRSSSRLQEEAHARPTPASSISSSKFKTPAAHQKHKYPASLISSISPIHPTPGYTTPGQASSVGSSAAAASPNFSTPQESPAVRPHRRPLLTDHQEEVALGAILEDTLYVLQGIEGSVIRYNDELDRFAIPPEVNVSTSIRQLVGCVCEIGWLCKRLRETIDASTAQPGIVAQGFYSAVKIELTDYYRSLAALENQIGEGSDLTLHRLLAWVKGPLEKLQILNILVDNIKGKHGGEMASAVYKLVYHGSKIWRSVALSVLNQTAKPIIAMIRAWMLEGTLNDPYQEFFVATDPDVPAHQLWHAKYQLRPEALPSFIPPSLANKILLIGKSHNLMRECSDNVTDFWGIERDSLNQILRGDIGELRSDVELVEFFSSLERAVSKVETVVNRRVMQVFMDKHKFLQHCLAIKRYLLLGQGDFVTYLMTSISSDLKKPSSTIFRHNLLGTLDRAVRSSNAQFDDPQIIDRLDVRLLEQGVMEGVDAGSGWAVFSLDYHVDMPISLIFTPEAMSTYRMLFNFLWRIQHLHHSLASMWKRHIGYSRRQNQNRQFSLESLRKSSPAPAKEKDEDDEEMEDYYADDKETEGLLHRCRILSQEMLFFLSNVQGFFMMEVIEPAWQRFQNTIVNESSSIEDFIKSHSEFLTQIVERCLLSPTNDQSKSTLALMTRIFGIIAHWVAMQRSMLGSGLELDTDAAKKKQSKIHSTGAEYKQAVSELRVLVTQITNGNAASSVSLLHLRFLLERLDFSGFYPSLSLPASTSASAAAAVPATPMGTTHDAARDAKLRAAAAAARDKRPTSS